MTLIAPAVVSMKTTPSAVCSFVMSDICFRFSFQLKMPPILPEAEPRQTQKVLRSLRLKIVFSTSGQASVEIVVFVILRALAGKLQREPLVGELIHPNALPYLYRSLGGSALIA